MAPALAPPPVSLMLANTSRFRYTAKRALKEGFQLRCGASVPTKRRTSLGLAFVFRAEEERHTEHSEGALINPL